MPEVCFLHPSNGRGYPLEISGSACYLYKEDGSPWLLGDLDWPLEYEGYYWAEVAGEPTLILNRKQVKRGWDSPRWPKLRAMWKAVLDIACVDYEGLGFSFSEISENWHRWYCLRTQRGIKTISARKTASCAMVLAQLAFELERLEFGSFDLIVGRWREAQYQVGTILRGK